MKAFFATSRIQLAALITGLALVSASPTIAQEKLTISLYTPPSDVMTKMVQRFAEQFEQRSGGAFTYEIFDTGQLFNLRDSAKAVARGDAGMTLLVTPYLSGIEPNINVLDLPVLNGLSLTERAAMLDGPLGQRLSELVGQKLGVVVPGKWFAQGGVYYWSTKKPLSSFADFNGMQMRIPGGAALVERVAALGANPISMPQSDVALALQQGVIDGTMGDTKSIVNGKLYESGIQHGFWDRGIVGFVMPLVNKAYWDSLSGEQQALFTEIWNEGVDEQRAGVDAAEAENIETLKQLGVTIVDASDAEVAVGSQKMMPTQAGLVEKLGISAEIMGLVAK